MVRRMQTSPYIVEAREVTRVFTAQAQQVTALRAVSLCVRPGAFVVLMGPSGSGKTTLLNIIGGLDQPTSGTVLLEGQPLHQLNSAARTALRRRIGFIFQSFALLPTASAYENVELGLRIAGNVPRQEWDARIRRCLGAVGLLPWRDHRPYELSGGQQQRVAIARALAIRPRLILADEPTGDLDSRMGRQVLSLLRALADHNGITLLIATHDTTAAEFATELYELRDGQIVAAQPSQVRGT